MIIFSAPKYPPITWAVPSDKKRKTKPPPAATSCGEMPVAFDRPIYQPCCCFDSVPGEVPLVIDCQVQVQIETFSWRTKLERYASRASELGKLVQNMMLCTNGGIAIPAVW
ncbi:uncharacterized protein LOC118510762 [Anopheles stephensi]|uniref:uncharacterized protein LOC118510762 n=1 Tax=Anopheles stephensi TaxID=30069 RepID=UPI0016589A02|nr:uncharacterized protein LOC118510762 [Anopheles stephensi]